MLAAATKSSSPDVLGPLLHGLAVLWPLWLVDEVDRMDGATFEVSLTTLFRRLGYGVEHTGRRGDYGADLVVTKDGRRTVVQATHWTEDRRRQGCSGSGRGEGHLPPTG